MAETNSWGLTLDPVRGQKVPSAGWDAAMDAINSISLRLSQLVGQGFLEATDFNGSIVAGQLEIEISAGRGFIGATGQRKPVLAEAAVQYDVTASTTNYVYVKQDGTCQVVTNPVDAPANSLLCCTCVTDTNDVTSVDNLPDGRVNILGVNAVRCSSADEQAGYLFDKLTQGNGVSLEITEDGEDENVTIKSAIDLGGAETAHLRTTAQPSDGATVQIAAATTKTYEFDSGGGVTGGNVSVTIGATKEDTLANLRTAIIAQQGSELGATISTPNTILHLYAKGRTSGTYTIAITLGGSHNLVAQDNGGRGAPTAGAMFYCLRRTITAEDVTATKTRLDTEFSSIIHYQVNVLTSTTNRTPINYNGTISTSGGALIFDSDSTVDLAAGNVLEVMIFGLP